MVGHFLKRRPSAEADSNNNNRKQERKKRVVETFVFRLCFHSQDARKGHASEKKQTLNAN